MLNVCLIGAGGVGTIAAYVLEKSQRCRVTAVLRSNYTVVRDHGFDIDSVDHGQIRGWKPHRGKQARTNHHGHLLVLSFSDLFHEASYGVPFVLI